MRRRFAIGAWPKLAGALLLFSFAGSVGADIRVPGGTPPPDSTTWILVSKPPKRGGPNGPARTPGEPGLQLHAVGAPDGRFVSPDLNPTTGAVGDIRDSHKRECPCLHFHGDLFGEPDPKDGARCGWGCVIRFDLAPDSVAFLSGAVMFEERAFKKAFEDNIEGALDDMEQAIEALEGALESVPAVGEGRWDGRNTREYKEALNDAIKLDKQAQDKLTEALLTEDKDEYLDLRKAAEKKTEKALKLKRKMVLLLAKELQLVPRRPR